MLRLNRERSFIISQFQVVLSINYSKLGDYRIQNTCPHNDGNYCAEKSYPSNIFDFFTIFTL